MSLKSDDLDMLKNPGLWPLWPILPMKRSGWECGVIACARREKDSPVRFFLWTRGMFEMEPGYLDFDSADKVYADAEAVVDDGWRID